tara:strand:+ start:647 stop:871 length:225 start_codon:yes stop_codon:yes gene_type:complete
MVINVTFEKDIITGTKKLGRNANLNADGTLNQGIHSLGGVEQPVDTIVARTQADEPDEGELGSRSKTNKVNKSY